MQDFTSINEEQILNRFREHQNLSYALIGGLGVTLICALVWGAFTVITEYQIGFLAIILGLIVGFGVRYFGAGVDPIYSIIGGIFALVSCLLGNLFAQIGFIAAAQSMGYIQVVQLLDFQIVKEIMFDTFSPMDILFFAIAAYEGFKFARRPITQEDVVAFEENRLDTTPAMNSMRLPIAAGSFLVFILITILVSGKPSGAQEFYYEDGSLLSEGNYIKGIPDGRWNYYHNNGNPQASGDYVNGLEQGVWIFYDESGQKYKSVEYKDGMTHGEFLTFSNETVIDSGRYENNREVGKWISRHPNGTLGSIGNYVRGKAEGEWSTYNDNGTQSSFGVYRNGNNDGTWTYYDTLGKLSEIIEFKDGEFFKLQYQILDGKETVIDGEGYSYNKHFDGTISSEGKVSNGKYIGNWKHYFQNGQLQSIVDNDGTIEKIIEVYDMEGNKLVSDGNGNAKLFYDSGNLQQEGEIKNGLHQGTWNSYYDEDSRVSAILTYDKGKANGKYTAYAYEGYLHTEGQLKDDEYEGWFTWYFQNGNVESKVKYVKGEKDGIQYFYSESGIEVKHEIYDNGQFVEEKLLTQSN